MHTIPALRLLPQHVPGRSLKALAVLVLNYAVIAPLAFGAWTPMPLRPLAQALLAVQTLGAPAGLLLRHFIDLKRTATVLREAVTEGLEIVLEAVGVWVETGIF